MSQGYGSGAVDEAVEALLDAAGAAEDAAVGLHAGGHDPAAAVSTGRCDRVDGAFEAVAGMGGVPATMTWNALS